MKLLRTIIERKEPEKEEKNSESSGSKGGFQPESPDGKRFVDKHVVTTPYGDKDVYGNGPELYNGEIVKPIDRGPMHGYNPGDDEKVYEEKGMKATSPASRARKRERERMAASSNENPEARKIMGQFTKDGSGVSKTHPVKENVDYFEMNLTEASDEDRHKAWKQFHNHAENTIAKIASRLKKHKSYMEKNMNDDDVHVHHPADELRDIARTLEDLYHSQVTTLKDKDVENKNEVFAPLKLQKHVHGSKVSALGRANRPIGY